MSVRAYKLIKIETEESPTFNLWRDEFITENVSYAGDEESVITIYKNNVEDMLKNFETYWNEYEAEDKTAENKKYYKKILKKMLEDCKQEGEYAEYYCY